MATSGSLYGQLNMVCACARASAYACAFPEGLAPAGAAHWRDSSLNYAAATAASHAERSERQTDRFTLERCRAKSTLSRLPSRPDCTTPPPKSDRWSRTKIRINRSTWVWFIFTFTFVWKGRHDTKSFNFIQLSRNECVFVGALSRIAHCRLLV
jgi:hypothetical protein